jgi:hypothetical protein
MGSAPSVRAPTWPWLTVPAVARASGAPPSPPSSRVGESACFKLRSLRQPPSQNCGRIGVWPPVPSVLLVGCLASVLVPPTIRNRPIAARAPAREPQLPGALRSGGLTAEMQPRCTWEGCEQQHACRRQRA